MSNKSKPGFSDSEAVTVYLYGITEKWSQCSESSEGMVSKTSRIFNGWTVFRRLLLDCFLSFRMIFRCCLNRSTSSWLTPCRSWLLMPSAAAGQKLPVKSQTKDKETYYCGLKLHILAVRRNGRLPLPDYIGITPADINVPKDIADDLHDTSVYADQQGIEEVSWRTEHLSEHVGEKINDSRSTWRMKSFQPMSVALGSQLSPFSTELTRKLASKQIQRYAKHKGCLFMSMSLSH